MSTTTTRTLEVAAACLGHDTDMFFVNETDHEAVARAKAVCAGCPVSEECYQANRTRPDGIFGGLTPRERRSRSKRDARLRKAAAR